MDSGAIIPALDWQAVQDRMVQGLDHRVYPGAVLWVAHNDRVVFHRAYGQVRHGGPPVNRDTLFDLASLTKPLATALVLMALVQQGVFTLEMRLETALPEFEDHPLGRVTLEQVLRHQGGWPSYLPLYKGLSGRSPMARKTELRRQLLKVNPQFPPGEKTRYSDLGFMALDWALERWTGHSLDILFSREIAAPLGIVGIVLLIAGLVTRRPVE